MSFGEWISQSENVAFLLVSVVMVMASVWVVVTRNLVHAALMLALALAGSAGLFLMLGAEFVAWTVVLVYIGAVVVLFLFGLMITRAPLGRDPVPVSHRRRWPAALLALAVFATITTATTSFFGWGEDTVIEEGISRTGALGDLLFNRFVIPFEAVSFLLLAALIGGIVLARKDPRE
ncbi:MAG TPA: NADH-quinone oxidoreductase subunit J [Acidimicrobiia bacterium]|nr:NADH-quinone oxidoreductase subunit J [Acidimicrobiia bacterium]